MNELRIGDHVKLNGYEHAKWLEVLELSEHFVKLEGTGVLARSALDKMIGDGRVSVLPEPPR